jgi:hypothetical protein
MTGNELQAFDQFIFQRLSTDATMLSLLGGTKCYPEQAPEGAIEPVVVWAFISSPDVNVIGGDRRAFTRILFSCRAITKTNSFASAAPIADRIDQLLMGASGSIPSANLQVMGMFREEPIRYVEVDASGIRYNHLGGRYRGFCTAIS